MFEDLSEPFFLASWVSLEATRKFYDLSFVAWALVSLSPLVLVLVSLILSLPLHLVRLPPQSLAWNLGGASFIFLKLDVCSLLRPR